MSQHLDDLSLLRQYLRQESTLLASPNLRVQPAADAVQLLSRTGELLASAKFNSLPARVSIRPGSDYEPLLKKLLLAHSFLPTGQCEDHQFYCYQYHPIPEGYTLNATPAMVLWKSWWGKRRRFLGNASQTDLLLFTHQKWYPVREMTCDRGSLFIKTWAGESAHTAEDLVVWLEQNQQEGDDDKTQFFFPQPGESAPQAEPRPRVQATASVSPAPVVQEPEPVGPRSQAAIATRSRPASVSLPADLQQVVRYHQGKLYVRTALGYVVVAGADLRCGLNPQSAAGLYPAARLAVPKAKRPQ